ncbi:unnamed protein product [Diatraea saccharalis]|uniref:Uncharacterized protein n=1 Tax=Diatraea saccharalis TaxID=40085 RepID=A0A9N9QYZ0_9NEOP|nr:unnamed protein product [Diatraea saccharalis]
MNVHKVFQKMQLKFALFVFCFIIRHSLGLRCYSCSFSTTESDRSCLTVTNSTPTVECSYRFCTIRRIEFLDPAGVVSSFRRGCDEQPDYLNHDITDTTYRTFYRACTTDLCNIGNGVQTVGGQSLSAVPPTSGKNLLVPGTGSRGSDFKISVSLFSLIILGYLFK